MVYQPGQISDPVLIDEFRRISNSFELLYNEGLPTLPTSVSGATYTQTLSDRILELDATSNAITLTLLPASAFEGRVLVVKRIDDTNTYVITIDADGTETIDGELTQELYAGESFQLYSNGSTWRVI